MRFRCLGFDASTNQVATYAPSSTGANESLFSLFVRYAGPKLSYKHVQFTLREAAVTRCDGLELARSHEVAGIQTIKESLVLRGRYVATARKKSVFFL